jgi:hypothetical protein
MKQIVGDEDDGAFLVQAFQCGNNRLAVVLVQAGGGLIEDEQWGADQCGAGNGNALTLSIRQGHAALAHHGIVATRQPGNKLIRIGEAGGSLDLLVCGIQPAQPDILPYGQGEEEAFLGDQGNLPAEMWRPMEEMKMPLMYLVTLISAVAFVLIYGLLISPKSMATGIKYGVLFGVACGISMGFGTYSVQAIPVSLAWSWFLGTLAETVVAGGIVGVIVKQGDA